MRKKLCEWFFALLSLPLAVILVLLTGCAGNAVNPHDHRSAAAEARWASQCYSTTKACRVLYQRPRRTRVVLEDPPSS